MEHPVMDEKSRPDCIYYCREGTDEGMCMHPNKGGWKNCVTMHMSSFDKRSCQAGMYQKRISTPVMDGRSRPDCKYCRKDKDEKDLCTHPKKGRWSYCDTMHIKEFDKHSCQPGMYEDKDEVKEQITMKFSGDITEAKKEGSQKFYLKLVTYGKSTQLIAVDVKGEEVNRGMLMVFREGEVRTFNSVNTSLGFPLDDEGALIIKGEHS